MKGRVSAAVGAACLVLAGLAPAPARAQSAGALIGGLAAGVIGGVIAGSIAAQAARQRPVIVYARPQRVVRVMREAPPRRRVARAQPRPMTPAAGPQGAAVINVSADPFASGPGSATTAVSRTR